MVLAAGLGAPELAQGVGADVPLTHKPGTVNFVLQAPPGSRLLHKIVVTGAGPARHASSHTQAGCACCLSLSAAMLLIQAACGAQTRPSSCSEPTAASWSGARVLCSPMRNLGRPGCQSAWAGLCVLCVQPCARPRSPRVLVRWGLLPRACPRLPWVLTCGGLQLLQGRALAHQRHRRAGGALAGALL